MSISKWIGASLGWSIGGPIGAVVGLALGSMVDAMIDDGKGPLIGESSKKNKKKYKKAYKKREENYRTMPNYEYEDRPQTQSGDFEVSLLILASLVIKADQRQDQRELDFVRRQFVSMYGKERANHAFKLFKNINKQKNISKRQICLQIKQMMDHASRLQLLHFLFGIAKADDHVSESELREIYTMSGYLGISSKDFESIKAMFYNSAENAYKVLEISKDVSDDEVKRAYRKMVKKYHPDRVAHLGQEHMAGAEEKFRQVQKAYEFIQKERGF